MLLDRVCNVLRAILTVTVLCSVFVNALPAASQGGPPISCVENPLSSLPAECATFSFEIALDQVSQTNGILGVPLPGDVLTGTFTVYNATPDVDPLPDRGAYVNALECMTLNFEDRTLSIDLSPVEVDIPPSTSDPGILVINDLEESTPVGSLFSDAVTFGMAGAGRIFLDEPDNGVILGGGGFAFGYGDGCLSPFQSPCPPTLVTDDALPGAPGDLSQVSSGQLTFEFVSFVGEPASMQATMLSIDTLPPIPCPEPTLPLSLALVMPWLGVIARKRQWGDHRV